MRQSPAIDLCLTKLGQGNHNNEHPNQKQPYIACAWLESTVTQKLSNNFRQAFHEVFCFLFLFTECGHYTVGRFN